MIKLQKFICQKGTKDMKLKNIYIVCKKNYEPISSCELEINEELCECYLKDELRVKGILEQLSCIEYLKKEVAHFNRILEEIEYFKARTQPDVSKFIEAKDRLTAKIASVIEFFESLGLEQGAEEMIGIDIKLPLKGDFTDFRKSIDDLDFLFTKCPFFNVKNERLCFDGLDVGSEWLTFIIVGTVGTSVLLGSTLLNNIAAFIDKCMVIKSHKLTIQQQENAVEKSAIEQKEKEELLKNLNRIYKIQVDNAIKELEEISGCKVVDGDERGRVEQSFDKLGKLLDKGMQIYASIDAPPEAKALFEPIEMQYLLIENELKALEKKNDKKE